MLATLLLAPAWAASPNFYWNVASANNSEIEANISASVSTIRFGQVRSPHPTGGCPDQARGLSRR